MVSTLSPSRSSESTDSTKSTENSYKGVSALNRPPGHAFHSPLFWSRLHHLFFTWYWDLLIQVNLEWVKLLGRFQDLYINSLYFIAGTYVSLGFLSLWGGCCRSTLLGLLKDDWRWKEGYAQSPFRQLWLSFDTTWETWQVTVSQLLLVLNNL